MLNTATVPRVSNQHFKVHTLNITLTAPNRRKLETANKFKLQAKSTQCLPSANANKPKSKYFVRSKLSSGRHPRSRAYQPKGLANESRHKKKGIYWYYE